MKSDVKSKFLEYMNNSFSSETHIISKKNFLFLKFLQSTFEFALEKNFYE